MVLHVPSEELADGLEQWPNTRRFIRERLGPTAFVIDETEAPDVQRQLESIGLRLNLE
jgi:hypothetical protein